MKDQIRLLRECVRNEVPAIFAENNIGHDFQCRAKKCLVNLI